MLATKPHQVNPHRFHPWIKYLYLECAHFTHKLVSNFSIIQWWIYNPKQTLKFLWLWYQCLHWKLNPWKDVSHFLIYLGNFFQELFHGFLLILDTLKCIKINNRHVELLRLTVFRFFLLYIFFYPHYLASREPGNEKDMTQWVMTTFK